MAVVCIMTSQTVYVAAGWSRDKEYYHTTKTDCRAARRAKNLQPWDREVAEADGKEICTYCAGEHETSAYDNSYQNALKRAAGGDD